MVKFHWKNDDIALKSRVSGVLWRQSKLLDLLCCVAECDVPVPGIPVPGNSSIFLMVSEPESKKFGTEKIPGIGVEKIWYRKKISEPVLKFFRILVLIWVPVSSRSRDFCNFFIVSEPVSKKIWYRKKSWNRSQKKLAPKKVSQPVSKKISTEKKVSESVSFRFWVSSHTACA